MGRFKILGAKVSKLGKRKGKCDAGKTAAARVAPFENYTPDSPAHKHPANTEEGIYDKLVFDSPASGTPRNVLSPIYDQISSPTSAQVRAWGCFTE
jgi:hypothetical protein